MTRPYFHFIWTGTYGPSVPFAVWWIPNCEQLTWRHHTDMGFLELHTTGACGRDQEITITYVSKSFDCIFNGELIILLSFYCLFSRSDGALTTLIISIVYETPLSYEKKMNQTIYAIINDPQSKLFAQSKTYSWNLIWNQFNQIFALISNQIFFIFIFS